MSFLDELMYIKSTKTKRISSYDVEGRNRDNWVIKPGETKVLAEIKGPAKITHIWLTQWNDDPECFRKVVLRVYWDNEDNPSILVPLGDFFCLGHSIVNSFQSIFFTASAKENYVFENNCKVALNCYIQMPFNQSARIEMLNESESYHCPYFYIDYEVFDRPFGHDIVYFHALFNRENPTTGWGHEITVVNLPPVNIVNKSDKYNYLILEAKGRGHLVGFNISVTNLQNKLKNPYERTWWGEGDEMIFIDDEPWPPSIHGTGSEDAFNQAYGMQDNAFLYNGTSIYESKTGGYQTSYIFYVTNPVRFTKSIRATIEHGHANHLSNEYSSVAYWYQQEPHKKFDILPVQQRLPLVKRFVFQEGSRTPPTPLELNDEMKLAKIQWQKEYANKFAEGDY